MIDSNIIIVGDFKIPLTEMDISSKQKIKKETMTFNDTLNKTDLIDIFKTFHPKRAEYTLFSSAHGKFSRIDPMLANKINLNKRTEITPCIFSNHNAMELYTTRKDLERTQTNGG